MARIIPKNTKVRMTFYKGVTIPDIIIGFIGLVLIAIAFSSNLAFRGLIAGGILVAFVPMYITINGDRLYARRNTAKPKAILRTLFHIKA